MRGPRRLGARLARVLLGSLLALGPQAAGAGEAAGQKAHPALWRVQHGTSTVYLFGSLHVLPQGYGWTTPIIESAMQASNVFIFEVPVDDAALKDEKQFIAENGLLSKRQTLRGLLTPTEFQTYSAVLRRAGLHPNEFELFRPWLAAVVLGLAYLHGDDLNSLRGADDDLMDFARAHGRQLLYLESVRDQMQLLNTGDANSQLKALKSLIYALPRSRAQEVALRDTWASGDFRAFTDLLAGYFDGRPEAEDFLIDRRNVNWMPEIDGFLARPGTTAMITVGAAHIGGRKGLLSLLCAQGYSVERVGDTGEETRSACGPGA